jgi:hypothetical protein
MGIIHYKRRVSACYPLTSLSPANHEFLIRRGHPLYKLETQLRISQRSDSIFCRVAKCSDDANKSSVVFTKCLVQKANILRHTVTNAHTSAARRVRISLSNRTCKMNPIFNGGSRKGHKRRHWKNYAIHQYGFVT